MIKPQRRIYVLDEASADRLVGLGLKLIAALREMLDDRRIDLPDDYEIGLEELSFLEAQAKFVADANFDVDFDKIF